MLLNLLTALLILNGWAEACLKRIETHFPVESKARFPRASPDECYREHSLGAHLFMKIANGGIGYVGLFNIILLAQQRKVFALDMVPEMVAMLTAAIGCGDSNVINASGLFAGL